MSCCCSRDSTTAYRALVSLAGLALVLVVLAMVLLIGNKSSSQNVLRDRETINNMIGLVGLEQNLVRRLTELATTGHDEAIRGLLIAQGLTVSSSASSAAAKAPAPVASAHAPASASQP